jgi:hypothetical protein
MFRNRKKNNLVIASLLLAVTFFTLTSCEKVIDVKLDSADKKYVVDAVLTNKAGGCKVLLTQTKDFNENNNYPGISGAVVTIKDEAGTVTTLQENSNGIYVAPTLVGESGKTYSLSVSIKGETFTGTSTMPEEIPFDSLFVSDEKFFDEITKFANVVFQDPAGIVNRYRFVQYVNGKRSKDIFIMDDDLADGKLFNSILYLFTDEDDEKIKKGDMVKVEMQCIDEAVYKYWYSLQQSATGSSNSATPANPVSNLKGGCLGYFSAQTSSSKTIMAE